MNITIFITDKMCIYDAYLKLIITEVFAVRRSAHIKNTLMQTWKLPYIFVFIRKRYPEKFAFLFPRTLKIFAREVFKFLNK